MQRACPIINTLTKAENRWQTKQQWRRLMYQRIYIDIVFMTNFLMDYMLLRFVGKFLHL
ncbi:sigma-E processing peptidase SpoIIGA, partial [Blautia sp.]|uniref:sigma-E processing peptidase SpoIIGA n=1 Tax=Blautia sp. TaxID=1955243 RepID=UPI003FA48741